MTAANVKELRVLPGQIATLCFPVHGVIGESNAALGQSVSATNLPGFYNNLGKVAAAAAGTLQYNSAAIYNALASTRLMALLAGDVAAAVDKAVADRFNAFWQKYSNIAADANQVAQNNAAKLTALAALTTDAQDKYNGLMSALQAEGMGGVVPATTSTQTFNSSPPGSSSTITTVNTGYTYYFPTVDVDVQYQQTMINLQEQVFATSQSAEMLPQLANIWTNQLQGIDLDVRRLQIAYINTFLFSPIAGVISRMRKNVGDYVRAGEPVMRVDGNDTVLLDGTVTYPGVPAIGSPTTVKTTLPGARAATTVTGNIVAVSGLKNNDQQWQIAVKCGNQVAASGRGPRHQLLPLHFSLNPEQTTVDIT